MILSATYSDSFSAMSVLLVHADPPTQERLGQALREEGYRVRIAWSGSDALELMKRHPIDAAFLDLGSPSGQGPASLATLRLLDPALPVILLAGDADAALVTQALDGGALAYATKPYDLGLLKALLRRGLTVRHLAALAQQRERAFTLHDEPYRSLVASTPDAVVLADYRGHITAWNQGAERLFLYREAEVVGQPLTLLMPGRYRAAHQQGLERFRFTGTSPLAGKAVTFDGLRKDGSEFPVELSLAFWKTKAGVAYGGILRDITQRYAPPEQAFSPPQPQESAGNVRQE